MGMWQRLRLRLWRIKIRVLPLIRRRSLVTMRRRIASSVIASQPEKATIAWGDAMAERLWTGLYSRYEPVIDTAVILDLGCSWGYFLKYLAEHYAPARLIGVDVNPVWETVDHGWRYGQLGEQLEFHCGSLPDIEGIELHSVDLITCTSVLQYLSVEQLERTLARAYELLRPGGQMILRTRTFSSYIGADLHAEFELPYVHLLFAKRDLDRLLEAREKTAPSVNHLTASTYLALFHLAGLEVLDARRRMNSRAPDVMASVRASYPWLSDEELMCAELEVQLARAVTPDDLASLGAIVDTRPKTWRPPERVSS
jgi:2-polyprenyl-3-methyl-5-hydroxy-6-metoxy-1,4-benzoquinol methylase